MLDSTNLNLLYVKFYVPSLGTFVAKSTTDFFPIRSNHFGVKNFSGFLRGLFTFCTSTEP